MERYEMVCRLERLNHKLYSCCYGLFDALDRYGETFSWMEKCKAYQRAAKVLEDRLGFDSNDFQCHFESEGER